MANSFIKILNFIKKYFYRVNWEEKVATELKKVEDVAKNATELLETTSEAAESIYGNSSALLHSMKIGNEETRHKFILAYAILMGVATYVFVHRTFAFFAMCLRASINLHDALFRGISRATMFFYNNNPSGRILNRFSKDISSIDTLLPPALMDCISVI